MQVVERKCDFCGIELGDGVREALKRSVLAEYAREVVDSPYLGLSQQTKQLTSFYKVHDHVEILGILKGAPQRDQERVLDLLQHAPLVVGMLDLLHLDHLGLLQHLDGVEALVVLGLDEVDSAEAARAEGALDGEVGERVLALGDTRLVERLGLELDGAAILRGRRVGAGVVWVYQVLYAGDIVRRRRARLGTGAKLLLLLLLLLLLGVGGVHRVGRLAVCDGRGRDRIAGVAGIARGVGERLVGLRLMKVEGARFARRRRRDGRVAVLYGRRRRIEVLGAVGVFRPLLLEEAQSRHWRSGSRKCSGPALPVPGRSSGGLSKQRPGMRGELGTMGVRAAQTAAMDALRGSVDARASTGAG